MERENFGNRFGVLVAMAGSAIGLGNLWRFPYLVGSYGGAAFIFVYIFCVFLLCLPIFMSEVIVGRRSRANAYGAFKKLAPGTRWKWLGAISVITPVIVVSYYSVVGGWSVEYFLKACTLEFTAGVSRADMGSMFSSFITSVWSPIVGHTIFLLLTAAIVISGVKSGIEKFGKIMMPLLFVLIIVIAARAATLPGAGEGFRYLFRPDFSKIDASVCSAALGQAFFSLSLGVGTILTYGSYVSKKENICASSTYTATADFLFALLASCAIMPAVFAFGLNPQEGPGLVFETLPFIFSNMPLGWLVAILFFLALIVAALTSSISLYEVGVAYLVEEKHYSRRGASILLFVVAWLLGILCSLSFGPLADFRIFGQTVFNLFDKLSANVLMPAGGLLLVIFVGWVMKKSDVVDELTNGGTLKTNVRMSGFIYFLIRYVCPLAVLAVFASALIF
ncbi:MAG: sodium-dependent transporter [Bacteroidetes bacterium]|uniref:Transporter n=1 Tax=Candidatus Cryptobacteroides merdigallinarum TaxID=2840770 RepID=A0A9D9HF21_9BACT|nr:sodium-dependent transporter [Candidatus Cryptobacteroides merdigallinarum]